MAGQPAQGAPKKKPLQTYEDYLAEEQAASQGDLDELESGDQLDAGGQHAITMPQQYDEPIPAEVFIELQRRFKALKRGSPERNYGIVDAEIGGKKYRYDAYAGQEQAGFPRDRGAGAGANWAQRLLTSFAGTRESQLQQRNLARNERLRQRSMNADELYRQAMLESGAATRRETRENRRATIREGSRTRALNRFLAAQPRTNMRTSAQEHLDEARAGLANAQTESYRKFGNKTGTPPKPDFTPDQAFTNMRQAETDLRDIESELNQIEQAKHPGIPFIPDWLEKPFDAGAYNPEPFDVELKDATGQTYDTIPAAEVPKRRKDLIEARDFARDQVARFREIVRNRNNQTQAPGTGDDSFDDETLDDDMEPEPEGEGEGWGEASPVPAGEGAAAPTPNPAPTPAPSGKPRRRKPPPEVLAKLPYYDQLYHQVADENPQMSDAEIKRAVLTIITQQPQPGGGAPARPAPTGPGIR